MKKLLIVALTALFQLACVAETEGSKVFMATGIKTGEATQTSVTVWTRLTRHASRNTTGLEFKKEDSALPEGKILDEMHGSAEGQKGEVRVSYTLAPGKLIMDTGWKKVIAEDDHVRKFTLKNLKPGSHYTLKVEGRALGAKKIQVTVDGSFVTAARNSEKQPLSFTVVTGQDYDRRDDKDNGHKIYKEMLKLKPDFFVNTGDVVYYDKPRPWAKDPVLARYKWQSVYSLPFQRAFHNKVSVYYMKDDHDITRNDTWPGIDYGKLTWEKGLKIFKEQTPMGDLPYRTIRWGKDLQIWLVAGREYRSSNKMPDGPNKTIWGKKQKKWFYDSVKKSDAKFKLLLSATPIVGPDRAKGKNDNHANKAFQHEGDEIRKFISQQKNMFIICGDRHWQYVSLHPTGCREYSCGPTSDKHAGGWSQKNVTPMHQYLKVKGGFLRVELFYEKDKPALKFQHYGVQGTVYNEEIQRLK
jgi:alkaline phosphatase D